MLSGETPWIIYVRVGHMLEVRAGVFVYFFRLEPTFPVAVILREYCRYN